MSHCTQPSGSTENGTDIALTLWSLHSGGRLTVIWEVLVASGLGTSRGDGERQKDLGGLKLEEAIGPRRVRPGDTGEAWVYRDGRVGLGPWVC